MGFVRSLRDCIYYDENYLGGKAYWLNILINRGYTVPKGYVLTKELYEDYVINNNITIEESRDELFQYDEIREKIYNGHFNEEVLNVLYDTYEKLKKPIIVRSSSSIEDNELSSCAGLYKSIGDIYQFNKFIDAIKLCWISSFNDMIDVIVGKRRDYAISLIVQEQIIPEFGGVAFTANPVTMDEREIVIEVSKDGSKEVVSGSGFCECKIFNKLEICSESIDYPFDELIKSLLDIEILREKPIDVEWVYTMGTLYFLQVRPITTLSAVMEKNIFETEDAMVTKFNLQNCTSMHSRWLEKKIPVRKYCKENNINLQRFIYYFSSNDKYHNDVDNIIFYMRSNIIEVVDGKKNMLIDKQYLKEIINKEYKDSQVLRIGESISTEYCGFSTYLDGKIYIETVKGGFTGLYEGFNPTKYIVDLNGSIISETIEEFEQEYFLNPNDGKWQVRDIEKNPLTISKEVIQKIINMTAIIKKKYGEVRLEWIGNKEDIYLFDLTVEKTKIGNTYLSSNILSSGIAKGKVKILNDISVFDKYIQEVSIRMGHKLSEMKKSDEIKEIKKKIINERTDTILVCEYPKETLVTLIEHVEGFVFRRGSLLCHLSIILREKGKPAIIDQDIFDRINDGDEVMINNGEFIVF
ncbi:PEP/pyruvate-binding domain-containing protein [Alkaliphilus serpentinus]|nr:PEP/pyruvate-binding domain-containing protein [Alkaliphilus serpentinus]